jgi:phage-related protein
MAAEFPVSRRTVEFIASAEDDLAGMPQPVKNIFGFAIFKAELGDKHADAKPLKGFGGAGVLEVVENHDGNTYRAVYTVKFKGVVYVLDVFQKKSKKGSATPKHDIDRIEARLKLAEQHHKDNYAAKRGQVT